MKPDNIKRKKGEKVEVFFSRISQEYTSNKSYQGVTIDKIEYVLKAIGKFNLDARDAVWCLLNNKLPSLFPKAEKYNLSDGATTAQIGSYVGILMRGKTKLDREGRDYWIKPLREVGAIEPVTFDSKLGFIEGHIPKSPNCSYRLSASFIELLKAYDESHFQELFKEWISEDSIRDRLEVQAAAEKASRASIEGNPHQELIQQSIILYAPHFLPGYILIYKDDADGDRISKEEQALMNKYGIKLELEDAFPDVILYNESTKTLWFIEAVTSDGEVDEHKIKGLKHICQKSGKNYGGSTTTYLTWKELYNRQQKYKNLAGTSRVWIVEDPQKEFLVQYYQKQ